MLYPFGSPVDLTLKKADGTNAVLSDYASVTLHIATPDGAATTRPGVVTYTFLPTLDGRHASWWTTTGPDGATDPEPFDVLPAGIAPLVSLEDAKAETNITPTTDDTELRGYILAASALLLDHPDYRIGDVCQVTSYTEWADAGGETVRLKHYPVTGVTSVTEYAAGTAQLIAAEPLDGGSFTGFGWDYADGIGTNGLLVRTSAGRRIRWCGNRVKVVYTAGSTSVPANLRLAVLVLIDHLWEMQRGGAGPGLSPGLEAESTGGSFGEAYGPSYALPNRVKELLEAYRKGPIVA